TASRSALSRLATASSAQGSTDALEHGDGLSVHCATWTHANRRQLMARKVGDFLLDRLAQWGVRRVFGYPGDGIGGIVAALGRAGDRFDVSQVRHGEEAAFIGCGPARINGEGGVCLAPRGPGSTDTRK